MSIKHLFVAAAMYLALTAFEGNAAHAGGAYRTADDSSAQTVVSGMANKAVRGVANVTTGWLEIPKQISVSFCEDGPVRGVFVGPLKGIGMTVVRTVAGAVELVTFFLPFPGFYDPYFEPAFVWQKE
ncbi:MAG: exosortase system-associated protein, TIGR04073 family [Geobacter sp.]|nr:MAG: exosortase system-associated protein, TIGR04073 family [Geobacter sp.]